jgi:ribose transport system permease protein
VLAIPFGVLCGALFGMINGFGVAYLRIPSMIVTLATNVVAQGLMVLYTGGFSPQDSAPPAVRWLATGFIIPGVPNAILVWAAVSAVMVFLYRRTTYRPLDLRHRQQRARGLSLGLNTRRIVMIAFITSGALSAFAGVLVAGYASKAAQSMGDAYLLPSIAVVLWCSAAPRSSAASRAADPISALLAGRHPRSRLCCRSSVLSSAPRYRLMQMPEAGRFLILADHLWLHPVVDRRHAAALRPHPEPGRDAGPCRRGRASFPDIMMCRHDQMRQHRLS